MTTKFSMIRDINGYNGFGLIQSDTMYGVLLSTSAVQNMIVSGPEAEYLAIFTYQPASNVFVTISDTGVNAVIFSGTLNPVVSEINPVARRVKVGGTISLITPDATAYVGVTLYGI